MNIIDCEECKWIGYDSLDHEEVCIFNDDIPIVELESCNVNELLYEAELLVIEGGRDK